MRLPKCPSFAGIRTAVPSYQRRLQICGGHFALAGCYESFYRSRCRVCEAVIERKAEHQKLCKRPRCKSRFRADPAQFEWSGYLSAPLARRASKKPDFIAAKMPLKPDRPPWRIIAGSELSPTALHCATVPAREPVEAAKRANDRLWRVRHRTPVNLIGGYRWPGALPLERELLGGRAAA